MPPRLPVYGLPARQLLSRAISRCTFTRIRILKERLCTPSQAERRNSCFFDGLDGHQNVAFELGRHPAHRLRSLRVTAPCNRTPPVTGSRASEGSRPLLVVGGGADLSGGGTCWGFTHAVPQRRARHGPSTPPRRDRGCQCPQAAAPPRRALGGQPWTNHNVVPCIAAAGGGPGTRRRAVVDRDVAGPGAACSRRAPPTPRARAAPVRCSAANHTCRRQRRRLKTFCGCRPDSAASSWGRGGALGQ